MTDWPTLPFEEIYAEPSRNGLNRPRSVRGTGYKMINMGELFAYGRIKDPPMERVQMDEREKAVYGVRKGDLLFARQSLVREGAGKCSIVLDVPEVTSFEGHLIRVRLNQDIADPLYYYYYFASHMGHANVQSLVMQVAAAGIRGSELARLPVPCPPLPTQRKIADILSAYDDLIENNARRIKLLEEMAQTIYREWFVHFRFPGHEQVAMVETELGLAPEGWEVNRLDQALVLQRGFDLPRDRRRPGRVPVLAATGVVDTHNEVKVLAPGVVTGRSGSLGTVIYVQENFWPLNTVLWVKEFRNVTPLHGFLLLQTLDLNSLNSGAAVPTLNRNYVHALPVVIPARQVIEEFDHHVLPMYGLMKNLKDRNDRLRSTRDLLLPKLVSGEVKVDQARLS